MFIKFKGGMTLLRHVREQSGKSTTLAKVSEVGSFQEGLGIVQLRAVKPDATLEHLPGGVERLFIASLIDGTDVTQALKAMNANDQVEYAEPVYVSGGGDVSIQVAGPVQGSVQTFDFPNDGYFPSQWDLHNTGQSDGTRYGIAGADLNAIPAWGITTGSSDVLVAFLSTGLPPNLTELTNLKYKGYRVFRGYNFVGDNSDFTDDSGIGSIIAGIAVATGDNSYGVAGVDWKCLVLPVKVVDANNKSSSDWFAAGLIYAADQGANVICIGWGGLLSGSAYNDAITYATSKGAILVAGVASGYGYFNTYPATYNKVILVGSTDNQDKRFLSSYGRADFMAPGDKNLGVWRMENMYGTLSGPLGSAPLAAGVISLMLSLDKSLTFEEVYDILKKSAADQVGWPEEDTPGWDQYYGWGRIDAYRALRILKERSQEIPERFGATQNYPNPFNPSTTIEYDLPKTNGSRPSQVSLQIYNLLGQPVATLVDELQAPGYHHARWDANAPSGVYFYRLQVDDRVVVRKMILAK
jgi:thermitase